MDGPIHTKFRPVWKTSYQAPFPGAIIGDDDDSGILLPNRSLQPGELVPYDTEMAEAALG